MVCSVDVVIVFVIIVLVLSSTTMMMRCRRLRKARLMGHCTTSAHCPPGSQCVAKRCVPIAESEFSVSSRARPPRDVSSRCGMPPVLHACAAYPADVPAATPRLYYDISTPVPTGPVARADEDCACRIVGGLRGVNGRCDRIQLAGP